MRDPMRGRIDHSSRPKLSEDPTLDRDQILLVFFLGGPSLHALGPLLASKFVQLLTS